MPHDNPPRSSWPRELREEALEYGKPEAIYTTANGSISASLVVGILFLIVGIVTNILYWIVFDQPQVGNLAIRGLLITGLILPIAGVLLLISAWRNSGVWVLVYPKGFFHWKHGRGEMIEWEEIRNITFYGVRTFGEPEIERDENKQIVRAWLPVKDKTTFFWKLYLLRKDGETVGISEHLGDSEELSQLIQERTFELFWPRAMKRLQNNDECKFGILRVSQDGLTDDKDDLVPWKEVGTIKTDRTLQIRKVDAWYPWRTPAIWNLPNPHVLLTLIETQKEWRRKKNKS